MNKDMFKSIDALCSYKDAYELNERIEKTFIDAMRENFSWQIKRQPFISYLAGRAGIKPEDIDSIDDVFAIPPLFVGVMKINSFSSIDESEIALTLTSSGTGGQKTHLFLDRPSLDRLERLAYNCFNAIGCVSDEPVHCFLMSYEPSDRHRIGTSWSQMHKRDLTPIKSENWVLQQDKDTGEFRFDAERWADRLIELSGDGPVRLLGFPAFICALTEKIRKIKGSLRLHPKSFIISGGGWKNHLGQPMTHEEFTQYINKYLGIDPENIRDTFGMAEHGVPYIACRKGHFHIPVYSRLKIIDPLDKREKPLGEEGLLCLYTPYNTAQPNQAILSTDLVRLGSDCECGLKGKYIMSVRRGGTKKHKGCAIAAQEILKKSGAVK